MEVFAVKEIGVLPWSGPHSYDPNTPTFCASLDDTTGVLMFKEYYEETVYTEHVYLYHVDIHLNAKSRFQVPMLSGSLPYARCSLIHIGDCRVMCVIPYEPFQGIDTQFVVVDYASGSPVVVQNATVPGVRGYWNDANEYSPPFYSRKTGKVYVNNGESLGVVDPETLAYEDHPYTFHERFGPVERSWTDAVVAVVDDDKVIVSWVQTDDSVDTSHISTHPEFGLYADYRTRIIELSLGTGDYRELASYHHSLYPEGFDSAGGAVNGYEVIAHSHGTDPKALSIASWNSAVPGTWQFSAFVYEASGKLLDTQYPSSAPESYAWFDWTVVPTRDGFFAAMNASEPRNGPEYPHGSTYDKAYYFAYVSGNGGEYKHYYYDTTYQIDEWSAGGVGYNEKTGIAYWSAYGWDERFATQSEFMTRAFAAAMQVEPPAQDSQFHVHDREADWPLVGSEDPKEAAGRFVLNASTGWDAEYFRPDGDVEKQHLKMLNEKGEWEPVSKQFDRGAP